MNAQTTLTGLTVDGGTAQLTSGGAKVIYTNALSISGAGRLDLTDNDMIIDYATTSPLGVWNGSAYTDVTGMIASAYNFAEWDGNGLTSTTAHDQLTGLGVNEASEAFGLTGSDTMTWGGFTIDATSVLVKYTYAGDANLDGRVDAADYGTIDNYVQTPGSYGYGHGDFNYDGVIDGADYGVLDNSIQLQGEPL